MIPLKLSDHIIICCEETAWHTPTELVLLVFIKMGFFLDTLYIFARTEKQKKKILFTSERALSWANKQPSSILI